MKKIMLLLSVFVSMGFLGAPSVDPLECPDLNIEVENDLISIHVTEQPLSCVMEQVGQKSEISIKVWRDIEEQVTLDLNRVSLIQFFREIGDNNALVYKFFPEKNQYRLIRAEVVKSSLSKFSNGRNAGAELAINPPSDSKTVNTPTAQSSSLLGINSKKGGGSDVLAIPEQKLKVKPGELLVRFKEHVKEEQRKELHAFLGSTVLGKIESLNFERLKLDHELTIESASQMYLASGLVRSAEPHAVRRLYSSKPNDPMFSEQWGLTAVNASAAWTITRGSDDVIVAVIDSGVYYNHEDLKENIWTNRIEAQGIAGVDDDNNGYVDDIFGWDFANKNSAPLDVLSHGTHVAGIIGAVADNGIGIAGVSPKVKLMVLKISDSATKDADSFNIIAAVEYAKNQGADIINCSFGGDEYQTEEFLAFQSFQDENNGLIVCAAGNEASNNDLIPEYPANYDIPGIISVAASREISPGNYALAEFSNYGAASVDVMAPGENILSTVPKTTVVIEAEAYFIIGTKPEKYMANGLYSSGTTYDNGLKADVVACGYGYPEEIKDSVKDRIALIQRGSAGGEGFSFSEKITNVQDRGAVGAIIYNDEPGDFQGILGISDSWIPAIAVSREIGLYLKSQIPTLVTLFNLETTDEVSYESFDGTSMAAPFVSGLAALLRAKFPQANFLELKHLILDGVDPIDSFEKKVVTNGQINLFKTLAHGDSSSSCFITTIAAGSAITISLAALIGIFAVYGAMAFIRRR